MGRKKRRWAKWRARQQSPGIGKLIAWAEWEEGKGGERDADCREKVQNNLCGSALE